MKSSSSKALSVRKLTPLLIIKIYEAEITHLMATFLACKADMHLYLVVYLVKYKKLANVKLCVIFVITIGNKELKFGTGLSVLPNK